MSGVDFASLYARPAPAPAPSWAGFPRFNFVGGHGDPQAMPIGELAAAAQRVIETRGSALATYHADSGPLGDLCLRRFVAERLKLQSNASITPDEVLITAGSMQGVLLITELLVAPGAVSFWSCVLATECQCSKTSATQT